ncbi:MAG: hypothetical protein K6E54_10805, partial [Bacteroidaceae bacterium]|nr:hypothetical protein [Bacteroidaceae bacterium]
MKYKLAVLILLLSCATCLKGQCNMNIDYSSKNIPTSSRGTIKLTYPNGERTILLDDTIKQMQKEYRLDQLGKYNITITFSNINSGKDSLERSFTLTGEEYKVETIV